MAGDLIGDKPKIGIGSVKLDVGEGLDALKRAFSDWSSVTPLGLTKAWLGGKGAANDIATGKDPLPTAPSVMQVVGGFIDHVYEVDKDVRMRIRERLDDAGKSARFLIQSKVGGGGGEITKLPKQDIRMDEDPAERRILTKASLGRDGDPLPKTDMRSDSPTIDTKRWLADLLR